MARDPFKHSNEVNNLAKQGADYVLKIMEAFANGDPNKVNDRTFRSCLDFIKFRQVLECRMFCLENNISGQITQDQQEDFTDMLDTIVVEDIAHEQLPAPD